MASGVEAELVEWCREMSSNGIEQHSAGWLIAKQYTIGGSSIATVMGINAFQTLRSMLLRRLGVEAFDSDIKPQWGNMLEDVIKREIEHMYKCTVYGEDLYITGHIPGTSYSPDGLMVVDDKIVLCEFKCPYSRIPSREPPKYYVPQVKMGLEIIPQASYGVYAEGVYRRCTWDQLGPSTAFDTTLVEKPSKSSTPVSYGFVGFWVAPADAAKTRSDLASGAFKYKFEKKWQPRQDHVVTAYEDDDFDQPAAAPPPQGVDPIAIPGFVDEYGPFESQSNDFGDCSPALMRHLMHALDNGRLVAYHSAIVRETHSHRANAVLNAELAKYEEFIRSTGAINYGILPWKLLRIAVHRIERTEGYLDPWKDEIATITTFLRETAEKNLSLHERRQAVEDFMSERYPVQELEYDD